MARIELHNISKRYGTIEAVHGVDLQIDDGEFVVFVGPSGCGKSTILRMIAGLEQISGGELRIDGQRMNDVAPSQRGIAMVFQSYALYPHMTVRKNLSFGLETARVPRAEIDRKVNEAAQVLQIEALLDRKPKQLSGGQRQRVAIGRAIVREPRLFLFDEPLSNLDAELRVQMRVELAALHDKLGATMIYVTHDQTEAMTLADKIVVLERGRLHQVGSPLELYHHPKNKFVAGFIGSPKMNFLDGAVETVDGPHLSVRLTNGSRIRAETLPDDAAVGDSVSIGIRPHHLKRAEPGSAGFTGRIELIELLGNESVIRMALDNGPTMTVCLDGSIHANRGDSLTVGFAPENVHVFDAAGNALGKSSAALPATP